jgi:hypothetical protein
LAGRYGIARFSTQGELISLVTQLSPGEGIVTQTSPAVVQAGQVGIRSYSPTTARVSSPHAWRLIRGTQTYRLLHETHESRESEGQSIRKLTDPETGEVVESWDETPSDLPGFAPPAHFLAHDSRGKPVTIASTSTDGGLHLGFALPGVHALGESTTIADAGVTATPDRVPLDPIATRAADWTMDPVFDRDLRAASRLALNLETTQRWFADRLGLASWDGEGASFHASVRGRHDPSAPPHFAAWGFNGLLIVEAGASPSGQFASESLDIVAHEFTHSVIGASAGLAYHDEAGSLNESLADFFGKSVQGFGDPIVGHEAGAYQRDVLHPAECAAPAGLPDCRQPSRYGDYRMLPLEQDHGGVHLNSGIMTLALSRVAVAQTPEAVARLVLETLRAGRLSPEGNLEEFAAALTARCLAEGERPLCTALEASFVESELLRRI